MENLDLQQLEGLLFSLVIIVFLIVIALVVYVVIANRRQRVRLQQARDAEKLAPRPERQVAGQILALVRDEPGGALQVEVAGIRYRRLTDIEDPQVRRQVVGAALGLIRFTGAVGEDVGEPSSMERTETWREDLREDSRADLARIHTIPVEKESQPQSAPAPDKVEEQFLNLLAEMGQAPLQLERPSIVSSLQQRMMPKSVELDRPRNFVDDIDDIVQRRVQLIPALTGRDLSVQLGTGDSVCFVFDGRAYENLEDVPNMTARQLIKDAIKEWEETF
jgi:membrane protein implicated in regulation of membrane protease activity